MADEFRSVANCFTRIKADLMTTYTDGSKTEERTGTGVYSKEFNVHTTVFPIRGNVSVEVE